MGTAIEDMATETETAGIAVMTVGKDSTTVTVMMTLANGGISLMATSGLLGGSPRIQRSSIHSLFRGKARRLHLTPSTTILVRPYIRYFVSIA